jgi:cytochrome b
MAMVWDLPLRLFHWLMVCAVTVAAITGYLSSEWWLSLHVLAGYALGYLLAFRMTWGFLGSYYSRFSSFPLRLRDVANHLFSVLRARPETHAGHNPVGAWMIVGLLTLMILLVVTGLIVLGGQENLGPFAAIISFKVGDFFEDIHEALAGALIGAICIHLLGVFVEVKFFRHPILKAMISGQKPVPENGSGKGRVGLIRGAILFFAVAGSLTFAGTKLGALPSERWRPSAFSSVYSSECGDCHVPYHPSLRLAANWQVLMAGLADHYGEDASLEEEPRLQIERYLSANDASRFDTEVAHRIGRIETKSNRMTDTPYWKKHHRKFDAEIFARQGVGSKVNCDGCHRDAAPGRFDDANILIPNEAKTNRDKTKG